MKKWLMATIGGMVALVALLAAVTYYRNQAVIFPVENLWNGGEISQVLGDYNYVASGEASVKQGIVYGFLPYWSVEDYEINNVVTHLAYFRLGVNGSGTFLRDAGYNIWNGEQMDDLWQQVNKKGLNVELTLFNTYSNEIDALLNCARCQDELVESIATEIATHRLAGINLDFEYIGTAEQQTRDNFTALCFKIKNMLKDRYPRTKLSIDVYGGAANMSSNIWDFPALGKIVDRVIVMGYDYKTRASSVPGPTSPTLGKSVWGGDIWEDVRALARYIPSEKVILAVPFYGYAWETTTGDINTAKTRAGSGETMTYRGARNILADKSLGAKEYWDEKSLTPYLVYREDGTWKIGFFENERSLRYKMDLIKKLNLGGMAIWALGYEGDNQELWGAINDHF